MDGQTFQFRTALAVAWAVCVPNWAQEPPRTVGHSSQPLANLATRPGEDWPDFLGQHRDGKSSETGLNWDWSGAKLKLLWSRPLLGGYGIGSTAAGRYYQLDGDGQQSIVHCWNAESGEPLWQYTSATSYQDQYGFDNGPRASPVIDLDSVQVYTIGVEGRVLCLDAANGEVRWSLDTQQQFDVPQNFFGVGSTPLLVGDLLLLLVGGSQPPATPAQRIRSLDDAVPNGSGIVAVDKRTGAVRYQTIDDLASYASPIVADLNGQPTGLAFARSGLHAFQPDTGQVLWSFPWRARKYESVNASTPVVDGGRILLTESYGPGGVLLRVDAGQPQVVWRDANVREQRLSCHWCTPLVIDGFAYACHGEKPAECELRCVELASGEVRWSQGQLGRCNLTYVDGHLLGLTDGGSLFAVRANPEKFELVARWDPRPQGIALRPPCYAAPIVSRGLLYLRDANRVYCLEMRQP